MRFTIAIAILISSSLAHAEREHVWWFGGTIVALSDADQTARPPEFAAGARWMLSLEDPPLHSDGTTKVELRLVPELFVVFYQNDGFARFQAGAGVRAELQVARAPGLTAALYGAAREKLSGFDARGAGEFAIGTYAAMSNHRRIGLEGGLGVIKRTDLPSGAELEALMTLYVGWSQ